jgi:hypothetical protein
MKSRKACFLPVIYRRGYTKRMLRGKKTRGVVALAIALLLISSGLAYAKARIDHYSAAAPCGGLTGIDRLLQIAYFIPSGGCIIDIKKGGCHDDRACTISHPPSGKSGTGHCTPTADKKSCSCVSDGHDDDHGHAYDSHDSPGHK